MIKTIWSDRCIYLNQYIYIQYRQTLHHLTSHSIVLYYITLHTKTKYMYIVYIYMHKQYNILPCMSDPCMVQIHTTRNHTNQRCKRINCVWHASSIEGCRNKKGHPEMLSHHTLWKVREKLPRTTELLGRCLGKSFPPN